MIQVTLHSDGQGIIGLPGRTVPLSADTIAAAREEAIAVLTGHAAVQALPLEVQALDDGVAVRFSVHPDGRVIVHRPGATGPEPVGPSQVPAPMAPPEAYIPTSSDTLATPIDVDPTPPPLPLIPSAEEQVAIATAEPAHDSPESTPALVDDLDMTIARDLNAKPEAVLEFTTGETVTVAENTVVGRRPSASPGETYQLVAINDTTRSVSKSHFSAIWTEDGFMIVDLSSANGTTVYRGGAPSGVRLTPGHGHVLHNGDRVAIGDEAFTVRLTSPTKE